MHMLSAHTETRWHLQTLLAWTYSCLCLHGSKLAELIINNKGRSTWPVPECSCLISVVSSIHISCTQMPVVQILQRQVRCCHALIDGVVGHRAACESQYPQSWQHSEIDDAVYALYPVAPCTHQQTMFQASNMQASPQAAVHMYISTLLQIASVKL